MSSAMERLLNLAFFFASTGGDPVTAERIRTEVCDYPRDQDEQSFLRMFERDKDQLRRMGLAIDSDERGNYVLDRKATYASDVELSDEEVAVLRTVGTALLDDPSFPFAEDLRLALAKLSSDVWEPTAAAARLADEDASQQGADVAHLSSAAEQRKRVTFGYTNSREERAVREIEPYGLFVHGGRWYLVGRDVEKHEVRTFAVSRMTDLSTNAQRPKTPDFERPADFDVARFLLLPFQYGPDAARFEARVRFEPAVAWRAAALSAGQGSLDSDADGSVIWSVEARSVPRLLRFCIEHGPGLRVLSPVAAEAELLAGLESVVAAHA